jgi:hypothetical protein
MFLGKAGVTLALPFLPSAFWSRRSGAALCTPPRRFMAWFAPNGMVMPAWTPATSGGAGNAWTMPPILAPLESVRNKLVILTGLDHQDIAVPPPGSPTSPTEPATGTGSFLTMLPVEGHETDPSRISLDQALLPALNSPACGTPRFASLQISLDYQNGLCSTPNCTFSRAISWTGGSPWPSLSDPGLIFDKMFALAAGAADLAQRQALRKSVLDYVLDQTRSLTTRLSVADRLRLDEHTTLVRNLETRLERIGKSTASRPISLSCSPPTRPLDSPVQEFNGTPSSYIQTTFPILVDLMATAFECDITRSIAFMIGTGNSENDYAFLTDSPTPHHTTALAETTPGPNQVKLVKIGGYEIQQAARLLTRLDAAMEFDGRSVLDRTTFYLSSNVADGQALNHWDMPILLAGGSGTGLKIDGRHINYIPQMPFPRPLVGPRSAIQTGRVFISILQAHGIRQDTFGLSSGGPLPELML